MKSAHEVVIAAETALRELGLSVLTRADQRRIEKVRAGLVALDDEQAETKAALVAAKHCLSELADAMRGGRQHETAMSIDDFLRDLAPYLAKPEAAISPAPRLPLPGNDDTRLVTSRSEAENSAPERSR